MSNESKHTEGPWEVVGFSGDKKCIFVESDQDRDNWNCLRCEVESDDCDPDMAMANAMLIAAAPDLLAVCAAAEDFARMVIASGLGVNDQRVTGAVVVRDAARAAIAKAKGVPDATL